MATPTPKATTTPTTKTPEELIEEQRTALKQAAMLQNAKALAAVDTEEKKLPGITAGMKESAANTMAQRQQSENIMGLAQGLNTGLSGQLAVSRNNIYGQGINTANKYNSEQLANFGQQRTSLANDLSAGISGIDANIASMKLNQFNADRSRQDTIDANNKQDVLNTLGAYSGNYQKRINELQSDGDTSNDWMIPYLQAAREDKIKSQNESQAQTMAAIGDFSGLANMGYSPEQIAALTKAYQDANAPKYTGGVVDDDKPTTLTYSQLSDALGDMYSMYFDPASAMYDPETGKQQMEAYISAYGGDYAEQFYAQYGITPTYSGPPLSQLAGQYYMTQGTAGEYTPAMQSAITKVTSMGQGGNSQDQIANYIMAQLSSGAISDSEARTLAGMAGITL